MELTGDNLPDVVRDMVTARWETEGRYDCN